MAASKRKIGIYALAGIAIASIIVVSLIFSGLNPLSNQATGSLIVSVKDAPVELQKLDLTITAIYVQGGKEDSWIQLDLIGDQPVKFDLLALKDISLEVSETQLLVGEYNKIRLEVSSALATYPNNNPKPQELKIPPGHIDIIAKFSILENQQTKLLIDIQPDTTAISNSGNFRPIIKTSITSAGPTLPPTAPTSP
jgi:hypothetical protein